VISGHEEHPILAKGRDGSHDLSPLSIRVIVLAALNRVAYSDDEIRVIRVCLAPSFLVNTRNGFTGPIAKDCEAETRVWLTTGSSERWMRPSDKRDRESEADNHGREPARLLAVQFLS